MTGNRALGSHVSHCCAVHGCKYADVHCPVQTGRRTQAYPCHRCDQVRLPSGYRLSARVLNAEDTHDGLPRIVVSADRADGGGPALWEFSFTERETVTDGPTLTLEMDCAAFPALTQARQVFDALALRPASTLRQVGTLVDTLGGVSRSARRKEPTP